MPVNWLLPAEKAARLPSLVSEGSVPFRALFACSAHKRVKGLAAGRLSQLSVL